MLTYVMLSTTTTDCVLHLLWHGQSFFCFLFYFLWGKTILSCICSYHRKPHSAYVLFVCLTIKIFVIWTFKTQIVVCAKFANAIFLYPFSIRIYSLNAMKNDHWAFEWLLHHSPSQFNIVRLVDFTHAFFLSQFLPSHVSPIQMITTRTN